MALRLRKDVQKASYYVWFLGAQEAKALRGTRTLLPMIPRMVEKSKEQEPLKVTLQVSHKGLKILQGSAKHFIPHGAITCSVQTEDIVACTLLLYNPATKCPLHVHAYRCDSELTAQALHDQLQVLINRPENQKRFTELEARLGLAAQLTGGPCGNGAAAGPVPIGDGAQGRKRMPRRFESPRRFPDSSHGSDTGTASTRESECSEEQQHSPTSGGPVSPLISQERHEPQSSSEDEWVYDQEPALNGSSLHHHPHHAGGRPVDRYLDDQPVTRMSKYREAAPPTTTYLYPNVRDEPGRVRHGRSSSREEDRSLQGSVNSREEEVKPIITNHTPRYRNAYKPDAPGYGLEERKKKITIEDGKYGDERDRDLEVPKRTGYKLADKYEERWRQEMVTGYGDAPEQPSGLRTRYHRDDAAKHGPQTGPAPPQADTWKQQEPRKKSVEIRTSSPESTMHRISPKDRFQTAKEKFQQMERERHEQERLEQERLERERLLHSKRAVEHVAPVARRGSLEPARDVSSHDSNGWSSDEDLPPPRGHPRSNGSLTSGTNGPAAISDRPGGYRELAPEERYPGLDREGHGAGRRMMPAKSLTSLVKGYRHSYAEPRPPPVSRSSGRVGLAAVNPY
uniref:PID domain-containing protein n=1 Tax=Anopheles coluzzii TaxID=1518534 RepID=A0A8W7Q593_ANOCL